MARRVSKERDFDWDSIERAMGVRIHPKLRPILKQMIFE
jgi:hypothetical protein